MRCQHWRAPHARVFAAPLAAFPTVSQLLHQCRHRLFHRVPRSGLALGKARPIPDSVAA